MNYVYVKYVMGKGGWWIACIPEREWQNLNHTDRIATPAEILVAEIYGALGTPQDDIPDGTVPARIKT